MIRGFESHHDTAYDVVVVGGGHAGIEASLAAARLGCRTLLLTLDRHEIGRMPCNPAIGGVGKGHLVREIDVLGGEMARAIDATGIQFRILNRSKGPAVWSPRAQADKAAYQEYMMETVLAQPGLEVLEGEVTGLLVDGNRGRPRVRGVGTADGRQVAAARVVLSSGTFLRGLMHVGDRQTTGGREGARSAEGLSGELSRLGFDLVRLKTGTPPRLHRDSIDYSLLEEQHGDVDPRPFSFLTREFHPQQLPCHLTYTNPATHQLIQESLDRSPLYAGVIEGQGPRYCPSIEDKVVRFSDRSRHLIFLEPEGVHSEEIYVNGLSTSLPAEVQTAMVRTIKGLDRAELVRFGYAVEYDSIPSYLIRPNLESKLVDGLFLAGQIVGTSGYEEAAAQGLMAGVNAVMGLIDQSPLILERSEAYIGVLVDDLVTKEISEPYRMFTSRAEHRLLLRCDNAETRLHNHAARLGLHTALNLARLQERINSVARVRSFLNDVAVTPLAGDGKQAAASLLRRPDTSLQDLLANGPDGQMLARDLDEILNGGLSRQGDGRESQEILRQVETDIKYEGYINKQNRLLRNQLHLENLQIPEDMDYHRWEALSLESREKLSRMRPATVGQAGRIDGVRAGDLAVLTVILKKMREQRAGS